MRLLGLTGNIATGKSTVLEILREQGAEVVDADALVHELLGPGTPATAAVVQAFGERVHAPDGGVNRGVLGQIVFKDPEALRRLEEIVHPVVGIEICERIAAARSQSDPPPALVIEGVKLVESGMTSLLDELWIVVARPAVQRQRLVEQRGMSPEEADARLAAQPSLDKLALAGVIIENSGSLATLRRQVLDAWQRFLSSKPQEGSNRA
ncbi:MAG: dephospho-CoA kinase [Ardenticatenaceae bacterium]|nr:dephospho-CoA kinase [Ardenticatenaceae bacterium]